MKRSRSTSSPAKVIKPPNPLLRTVSRRRRKELVTSIKWNDQKSLRELPLDLRDYILTLWLPRHWFHLLGPALKSSEDLGFFENYAYFRKKGKNWYVDHEDMEKEKVNTEGASLRSIVTLENNDNLGCVEYYSWLDVVDTKRRWKIHPFAGFPAFIWLRPVKRWDHDNTVELKFRGCYHNVVSGSWLGVRNRPEGEVDYYVLKSIVAEAACLIKLLIGSDGIDQWSVEKRENAQVVFWENLL